MKAQPCYYRKAQLRSSVNNKDTIGVKTVILKVSGQGDIIVINW